MDQPSQSGSERTPWQGDQAPCVYCGQVIGRSEERCPHCRTSFSLAVRRASREVIGPWYYLDSRNPSGRGVTFETLIKMIEKGRLKSDSVVRGPTTHQDWMFAAETPRLAKYLGLCPHCFAEAKPEDTYCARCQLNMNQRPTEPRPGIPADLAKAPVHAAAYEVEKQLAATTIPSDETLEGEPLDIPVPPASGARAGLRPAMARPEVTTSAAEMVAAMASVPAPATSSAAAAAAAAAARAGGERPSRAVVAAWRTKPKIWIVLLLTWATLVPLLVIFLLTAALPMGARNALRGTFGMKPLPSPTAVTTVVPPEGQPSRPPNEWVNARLADADAAEKARDYAGAIKIYRNIIAATNEAALYEPRIRDLDRRLQDERRDRMAKLQATIDRAESLKQERRYDEALAELRTIGPEDRARFRSLGFSVENMEQACRAEQAGGLQEQREKQLAARLAQAAQERAARHPDQALKIYREVGATYPPEMIQKFINLAQEIKTLEAQVAAAMPPPPKPKPPEPPKPPELTAEQAKAITDDLMGQALTFEKSEKLAEALAKFQEVKTRVDRKYWPENLEDRIRTVKAKQEALQFFGVETPKKPKTSEPPK